jgi:hypothetical protein
MRLPTSFNRTNFCTFVNIIKNTTFFSCMYELSIRLLTVDKYLVSAKYYLTNKRSADLQAIAVIARRAPLCDFNSCRCSSQHLYHSVT